MSRNQGYWFYLSVCLVLSGIYWHYNSPDKPPVVVKSTNSGGLLGTGIVKSVDRSNPILRDAGLEIVTVKIVLPKVTATETLKVIVPMSMVFQESDQTNIHVFYHYPNPRSTDTMTYLLTKLPPAGNGQKGN